MKKRWTLVDIFIDDDGEPTAFLMTFIILLPLAWFAGLFFLLVLGIRFLWKIV